MRQKVDDGGSDRLRNHRGRTSVLQGRTRQRKCREKDESRSTGKRRKRQKKRAEIQDIRTTETATGREKTEWEE